MNSKQLFLTSALAIGLGGIGSALAVQNSTLSTTPAAQAETGKAATADHKAKKQAHKVTKKKEAGKKNEDRQTEKSPG